MRTTQAQIDYKTDWDTTISYYKWNIYLSNKKYFSGYSKRLNEPEVFCKIKLLKRCMIRLKKKKNQNTFGYFTPGFCDRIEIYKRTSIGEYKEKLVTLYPNFYELSRNERFNTNKTIIDFLNLFYSMIKNGTIEQLDYSKIGYSKINEDELFNMAAGKFNSIPELQEYGNELMILGFTYERVKHFIEGYKEKNLSFN